VKQPPPASHPRTHEKNLVLFDGPCNLCNASVLFIIDRDPAGRFAFASLQSEAGQAALARHGITGGTPESVVLIDERGAWRESDAAVRIAAGLSGPWRLAGALRVVPRPIRDAAYRYVARRRYRWFGSDACRLPTPQLLARMVPGGNTPPSDPA
jgi:predicted DCC family thiol-disulfide oxidoreductase YuxK